MKRRNDKYGINIKQWCREHEAEIKAALDSGRVSADAPSTDLQSEDQISKELPSQPQISPEMLARHREKISLVQHERLIHLIVTVMVVFVELFVVDLALLHPEFGIIPAIVMLVLAVLLAFYFYHYFFLENTLQRWYRYLDEMQDKLTRR